MSLDLFGEFTLTIDDIAQNLIEENKKFYSLSHKMGTKQGFYLMDGVEQISGVMKTGFYAIYKNKKCVYVGHSMNEEKGISNRISRFIKGVLGKCTFHENHSGAAKYRFFYGEDFSNLELVVMPYPKVPKEKAAMIENAMIRMLKPKFNS